MDASAILRIAAIVLTFVFLDLLIVELRRAAREATRIARRIAAYGDLPIVSLAATTPGDVQRLVDALERVPALLERGEAALKALHLIRR